MLNKEITSIIRKYGCKGYIIYPNFRKSIHIIISSLMPSATTKSVPQMSRLGLENIAYYKGVSSIVEPKIVDGDLITIGNEKFSVVSSVDYEYNGKTLYRKILLCKKEDII